MSVHIIPSTAAGICAASLVFFSILDKTKLQSTVAEVNVQRLEKSVYSNT
jgi:hypothetical protein